jgi:TldD protein
MLLCARGPLWSRRGFLRAGALSAVGLTGLDWTRALRAAGANEAPSATVPPATPLSDLTPILQEIVREMEKKVPYASVLVSRQGVKNFEVDDRSREIQDRFPTAGAVFTVWNGAYFEEWATSELDPDQLRAAGLGLASGARHESGGKAIDPGPALERTFDTPCIEDPRTLPLADRLERVADIHRRARQGLGPEFANCEVSITQNESESLFVNRTRALQQKVLRTRGTVTLFARNEQRTVNDNLSYGGTGGLELATFTDEDLAELARETKALLGATPVPTGEHQVVGDGSVTGTLAHESFGHGVELDMFVKQRALAAKFIGKRVGSDFVNIVDDPSLPKAFGSYFFDDEGVLAGPTNIVVKGIFERGLSDLMSATALGVTRSANGRRQDFRRKCYARMSNTFFTTGKSSVEELIDGVKQGYLLTKLSHGMEDPKGWGIMVVAQIGQEIKDGKLTGRYANPVGITGYVPDVLGTVDGVSSDFVPDPGFCGKGFKEFVPVSTGGPHIRFRARLA